MGERVVVGWLRTWPAGDGNPFESPGEEEKERERVGWMEVREKIGFVKVNDVNVRAVLV